MVTSDAVSAAVGSVRFSVPADDKLSRECVDAHAIKAGAANATTTPRIPAVSFISPSGELLIPRRRGRGKRRTVAVTNRRLLGVTGANTLVGEETRLIDKDLSGDHGRNDAADG